MHKWIMFTFLSIASLLAVGLLAFGLPEKPIDESSLIPEGAVLLKVEARNDFTFSQDEYTAQVGETVIFKYSNKGGIHSAKIDELGIDLSAENNEYEHVFTEPGEYIIYCNVPCGIGHATMTTKLVITEAVPAA